MSAILTFEGLSAYDEEIKALIQKNAGGQSSEQFDTYDKTITWNEDGTVYTQTWTKDNKTYQTIYTEVSDTVTSILLVIDGKNAGSWTTTIDEANRMIKIEYT